jgi:hypothetical protein
MAKPFKILKYQEKVVPIRLVETPPDGWFRAFKQPVMGRKLRMKSGFPELTSLSLTMQRGGEK